MRTKSSLGLLVGIVLGCRAQAQSVAHPTSTDTANAAAPVSMTSRSAAIVEVRMTGNGSTQAAYVPSTVTIHPGTVIRFINQSGGPHNVTFYADSIPPGAAAALKAGMPNAMSDLIGPLLTTPRQSYDVSFTGAPAGTYKAYCLPHAALGMKITIVVR